MPQGAKAALYGLEGYPTTTYGQEIAPGAYLAAMQAVFVLCCQRFLRMSPLLAKLRLGAFCYCV